MNDTLQTANTIIDQLGGNRFVMMTGSKAFVSTGDGVQFKVGRNSRSVNFCRVTLTPADLYDVEYGFLRAGSLNVRAKSQGLYADQLQEDFTRHTGLYTRL